MYVQNRRYSDYKERSHVDLPSVGAHKNISLKLMVLSIQELGEQAWGKFD